MFSPVASWESGLKPDVDPEEVYEPFQRLLEDYLPMSQQELSSAVGKDRTTVSKWKSAGPGGLKATLAQQRDVTEAVRSRLGDIQDQVSRAEEMIEALEDVVSAYEEHRGSWDEETRQALEEANDRVRDLLEGEAS